MGVEVNSVAWRWKDLWLLLWGTATGADEGEAKKMCRNLHAQVRWWAHQRVVDGQDWASFSPSMGLWRLSKQEGGSETHLQWRSAGAAGLGREWGRRRCSGERGPGSRAPWAEMDGRVLGPLSEKRTFAYMEHGPCFSRLALSGWRTPDCFGLHWEPFPRMTVGSPAGRKTSRIFWCLSSTQVEARSQFRLK